jgi:predicted DNA-binding transcriptional regulator AlpA
MQIQPYTFTRLVRTEEAAKLLGLAPSTLEKYRVLGGGPRFVRLGTRAVAYDPNDLQVWAKAIVVSSTAEYPSEDAK